MPVNISCPGVGYHSLLAAVIVLRVRGLGKILIVFGALSLVFSVVVGISHQSFTTVIESLATMLCIFAMPTFALAEFLPLCDLSGRLYKLGAMVCGKYSAAKIEQCNAVVISSEELFPAGSIELYSMKPLGANNIDNTLNAAASVEPVCPALADGFFTIEPPGKCSIFSHKY